MSETKYFVAHEMELTGPNWPIFSFRQVLLADQEGQFLRQSGVVVGTVRQVPDKEQLSLLIELISTEALKTSET